MQQKLYRTLAKALSRWICNFRCKSALYYCIQDSCFERNTCILISWKEDSVLGWDIIKAPSKLTLF